MFRKILVANRGEIALRVMRTCEDMGIGMVAVFSEADRLSPHVVYADEAYLLGPPPPTESYLNFDRILGVAKESGADAIHPGYGFIAENADFADACADAGLAFIGPNGKMIRQMGDKLEARRIMEQAGVPVVPGGDTPADALEDVLALAERIGYPVLVKPSGGGGGKGMHVVHDAGGMEDALRIAANEARSAFGDPTGLPRKVPPTGAAHRDPAATRQLRQRAPPRRARVLRPAPPPEDHRGEPFRGRR